MAVPALCNLVPGLTLSVSLLDTSTSTQDLAAPRAFQQPPAPCSLAEHCAKQLCHLPSALCSSGDGPIQADEQKKEVLEPWEGEAKSRPRWQGAGLFC